jgi:hypothetical protein
MSYPTRQCALASVNWIQLRISRCFGSIYGASRSVGAARRRRRRTRTVPLWTGTALLPRGPAAVRVGESEPEVNLAVPLIRQCVRETGPVGRWGACRRGRARHGALVTVSSSKGVRPGPRGRAF